MSGTAKTLAVATRGPAWQGNLILLEQPAVAEHLAFMAEHIRSGVFETAGPFASPNECLDGDLVGLVVFTNADPESALRILESDPARLAGTLEYKVLRWHL